MGRYTIGYMQFKSPDGSTIEAYRNREDDCLVFRRYDPDGKEVEWESFGISFEEFEERFKEYRRV